MLYYKPKGVLDEWSLFVEDDNTTVRDDDISRCSFCISTTGAYQIHQIKYVMTYSNISVIFSERFTSDYPKIHVGSPGYFKKFAFYKEGLLVSFCY